MHSRRLHFVLASLLLAAFAFAAHAQKAAEAWAEWETLSPENEEFTVLMPKNPTTESTTFPYHKMELNARLYMATSSAGPVLAITSLSGIKSDPAQYTEFARFNSYIDAFKTYFPSKVRSKETIVKMTLVSSRPFHGHTGRSYKITLGDLSGSVNAFVTRKRFYAIVSLKTRRTRRWKKSFSAPSFCRNDKTSRRRQLLLPIQTSNGAQISRRRFWIPTRRIRSSPKAKRLCRQLLTTRKLPPRPRMPRITPAQTPGTADPKKAPITGGMLNGKAIYLPVPEAPAGDATGVVLVAVLVDEQGGVIEARAVSGPQHLHAAAVAAARLARFSPTLLMGEPVRVSGTLSYNFVRSN